jgi:hypothetical protein
MIPFPNHKRAASLQQAAQKFLFAVDPSRWPGLSQDPGAAKGQGKLHSRGFHGRNRSPRKRPAELLIILAAIADEGIPVQTIAPEVQRPLQQGR